MNWQNISVADIRRLSMYRGILDWNLKTAEGAGMVYLQLNQSRSSLCERHTICRCLQLMGSMQASVP